MVKTILGLAAGLALLTGSVITAPSPAQAAPKQASVTLGGTESRTTVQAEGRAGDTARRGYKRCRKGRFCIFTGRRGHGGMASFRRGAHDLRDFGMNNNASSFWNRTNKFVRVFKRINFRGACLLVGPKVKVNPNRAWNNKLSSLKVRGKPRRC